MRVLVADDDPFNRDILSRLIARLGMEVDVASDGAEALSIIGSSPPYDLALLDLSMPVMDGLEATRLIRKSEAGGSLRRLPLIALTGSDEDPSILEAGFDEMLQKPIGAQALKEALERWGRGNAP